MKSFCVILFALTFVLVSSNDASFGYRNWEDHKMHTQKVFVYGSSFQPRPSYILTYPMRGAKQNKTIVYIAVKDSTKYKNGGSPILLSGGIGYNYVRMLFRPQTSIGLNLTTEIWGH